MEEMMKHIVGVFDRMTTVFNDQAEINDLVARRIDLLEARIEELEEINQ